ncbi:protein-disulfide reductase DsbD family protein [Asticcacaulis sp. ZE23SCel15]|uniref:protein-disulfide reductase DsbD family protein n=1 Tax=Asticcacaulis sp. ZE23SCel15 TaxID=3059027 RepID=UPI00265DD1F2|nr:thioredoxin family protein [Asticcacaulis sp. ZE23SCel15]WKL58794.1 protein-disulfide reductase DsbD family protein [Asticcacaulis sp. ZE23SCel15]
MKSASAIRAFVLCLMAFWSGCAFAQSVKTAHLTTELVAEHKAVAKGGDIWIAIRHEPLKGWHTYWQNPGDTGLAPVVTWSLPDKVTVGEPQWKTPERQPYMGLVNYGYSGETYLFYKLTNSTALNDGDILPLKARVDFLVCEKVCVPETVNVSLNLPVGTPGGADRAFQKAFEALPKPAPAGYFQKTGNVIELGFPSPDNSEMFEKPSGAYFFPITSNAVPPAAHQTLDTGADGFTLKATTADDKPLPGPISGVVAFPNGNSYQVTLNEGNVPLSLRGLGGLSAASGEVSVVGVIIAAGLAFVGGIILNLMPCVFPILSMKILAVSRAGHDHKLARKESLLYGAGVIISFVALAVMISVAQALGSALGWGFQLQSPFVTAALSIVMLLVALNLSGLFNIGSSVQGLGAGVAVKNPYIGAFLTGVLAVVVAAPCTAPFMATAIGVALAQGGFVSFVIFLALGIGFALPIVGLTYAITYLPGLAKRLPKPGPWMDRFKHILAVPMYLAALWMVWVFAQQVSGLGLFALIIALGLIVLGVARTLIPAVTRPVLLGLGIVLAVASAAQTRAVTTPAAIKADVPYETFSVERIAQLRAEGKNVMVDLTAAWCVSCKVNERLVFHTDDFAKALKATNTVYMVGDWTNQDARISQYLSRYGRSGVPLYVWYGPNGAEPVILPQLLNKGDVIKMMGSGA